MNEQQQHTDVSPTTTQPAEHQVISTPESNDETVATKVTPGREEFGYSRTHCACETCVANCQHLPGYLIPIDIERISRHLGYKNIAEFARECLLASPGATVRKARNLAKWFKVMDMSCDESLRTLIAELERIASVPRGTKKKRGASGVQRGNVKAVLDDIIHLTYRDAMEIAAPNRISALEL